MAVEYTWSIISMECLPSINGELEVLTNVVKTVHWSCGGNDSGTGFVIYGSANIEYVDGTFTEYSTLTKNEVLGWLWAGPVNKDAIESNVESEINTVKNSKTLNILPLPWN
jgi:hypothetical protein